MNNKTTTSNENALQTIPSCIILLNGFPSVGKLTIARGLQAKLTSTFVIDYRLWNDPPREVGFTRWSLISALSIPRLHIDMANEIRHTVFHALSNIPNKDAKIILTSHLSKNNVCDDDDKAFGEHVSLAEARKVPLVFINLVCDEREHINRLIRRNISISAVNANRLTTTAELEELLKEDSLMVPEDQVSQCALSGVRLYHAKFSTTGQSIEESVQTVLEFLSELEVNEY